MWKTTDIEIVPFDIKDPAFSLISLEYVAWGPWGSQSSKLICWPPSPLGWHLCQWYKDKQEDFCWWGAWRLRHDPSGHGELPTGPSQECSAWHTRLWLLLNPGCVCTALFTALTTWKVHKESGLLGTAAVWGEAQSARATCRTRFSHGIIFIWKDNLQTTQTLLFGRYFIENKWSHFKENYWQYLLTTIKGELSSEN